MVVAPELIKIRLQVPENRALYRNSLDAAKAIVRAEGVVTLFRGTAATLARNGTWNGGYFGSISFVRGSIPPHNTKMEKLRNDLIAGTIAGTVGTILNTPFGKVTLSRL